MPTKGQLFVQTFLCETCSLLSFYVHVNFELNFNSNFPDSSWCDFLFLLYLFRFKFHFRFQFSRLSWCDLPCEGRQPWEQSVSQPFFPTAKDTNFLPNKYFLGLHNYISKFKQIYVNNLFHSHSFQQQRIITFFLTNTFQVCTNTFQNSNKCMSTICFTIIRSKTKR